jgi:hypothetical protein
MSNQVLYVIVLCTKVAGKRKVHEDKYAVAANTKEQAYQRFDALYPGHRDLATMFYMEVFEDGVCRVAA